MQSPMESSPSGQKGTAFESTKKEWTRSKPKMKRDPNRGMDDMLDSIRDLEDQKHAAVDMKYDIETERLVNGEDLSWEGYLRGTCRIVVDSWQVHKDRTTRIEGDGAAIMTLSYGGVTFRQLFSFMPSDTRVVKLVGPFYLAPFSVNDRVHVEPDNIAIVKEAALELLHEAMGKEDVNLTFLVPKVIALIGRKGYDLWPSATRHISEFLLSHDYAVAVLKYSQARCAERLTLMEAKAWKRLAGMVIPWDQAPIIMGHYKTLISSGNELRKYRNGPEKYLMDKAMPKWWALIVWWAGGWKTRMLTLVTIAVLTGGIKEMPLRAGAVGLRAALGLLLWYAGGWWAKRYYSEEIIKALNLLLGDTTGPVYTFASMLKVPRTCSEGIDVPPMDSRARLRVPDSIDPCKGVKTIGSYGSFIRNGPMVIPRGCIHDVINGLKIRFLFERVTDVAYENKFLEFSKKMIDKLVTPWVPFRMYSEAEWLNHLLPARVRKMLAVPQGDLTLDDLPADIFVKLEAYLGKTPSNFKPRIIQGRKLRFQRVVGPFFYSVSKWLAELMPFGHHATFDSGLTARELGEKLARIATYRNKREMDVSNWDGSLPPVCREIEKYFISKVPGHFYQKEFVLQHWEDMRGQWQGKVFYSAEWGRKSGDMWTSCFNSLLNFLLVCFILGIDIEGLFKGDDNLIGDNSELIDADVAAAYAKLGMKCKVVTRQNVLDLGYCSGSFYPVGEGFKWSLNPFRVLAKFGLNLHGHPKKHHQRLLLGTAISMLPIGGHVPFLGHILRAIVASSGDLQPIHPTLYEWQTTDNRIDDIDPGIESHFCGKYQIDTPTYDRVVASLSLLTLDDFPLILEDPVFTRGFAQDVGVELHEVCGGWFESQPRLLPPVNCCLHPDPSKRFAELAVVSSAPFWEEALKGSHPIAHFVFGLVEGWVHDVDLSSQVLLHMLFWLAGWFAGGYAYIIRVLVHLAWNLYVFRKRGPNYGSIIIDYDAEWLGGEEQICGALVIKLAELLSSIADCLASIINRITAAPQYASAMARALAYLKNLAKKATQRSKKSKKITSGGRTVRVGIKKPKGSLGRSLLTKGAGLVGGLMGPMGSSLAEQGAGWLSDILGMGDYEVKANSLLANGGVPTFKAGNDRFRLQRREYLGDVTGSTAFSLASYSINPGLSTSFPWLSLVAANFQLYKFHGLIYEFVSTSADALNSTNTALGTVVMATSYNAAQPSFLNKAEMEQYEFSCSTRPSANLLHPVECNPAESPLNDLYIRVGSVPSGQSQQFYDLGEFQLATVGMQAAATIGELWVSYDVELIRPRIQPGGVWPGEFYKLNNGPYDNNNMLGTVQTTSYGDLGLTISATGAGYDTINFPASITAGRFMVTIVWKGGTGVVVTPPSQTLTNLTLVGTEFQLGTTGQMSIPASGSTAAVVARVLMVTVNGYSATGSKIQLTGATLPTTQQTVDVYVVSLPLTNTFV